MPPLVDAANERTRLAAMPVTVTSSSLIHKWIIELLEQEIAK